MFQGSFGGELGNVSRKSIGRLKGVLTVSMMFQDCFNCVLSVFSKKVLRMLNGYLMAV